MIDYFLLLCPCESRSPILEMSEGGRASDFTEMLSLGAHVEVVIGTGASSQPASSSAQPNAGSGDTRSAGQDSANGGAQFSTTAVVGTVVALEPTVNILIIELANRGKMIVPTAHIKYVYTVNSWSIERGLVCWMMR